MFFVCVRSILIDYNAGHLLSQRFEPTSLCIDALTGRVYHVVEQRLGGIGLVKSSLSIQLSAHFRWAPASRPSTDQPHSTNQTDKQDSAHQTQQTKQQTQQIQQERITLHQLPRS